jgi:DNA-binding CsgD family transcriptional regulator
VLDLPLTPRQQEIAVQIGLGKAPETIQSDLDLSAGTYRRHVEDIHLRLDVRSRAQLMAALMARPAIH